MFSFGVESLNCTDFLYLNGLDTHFSISHSPVMPSMLFVRRGSWARLASIPSRCISRVKNIFSGLS